MLIFLPSILVPCLLLIRFRSAPPESEQPHPNQDLLEGHFEGETGSHLPDVDHKVRRRSGASASFQIREYKQNDRRVNAVHSVQFHGEC